MNQEEPQHDHDTQHESSSIEDHVDIAREDHDTTDMPRIVFSHERFMRELWFDVFVSRGLMVLVLLAIFVAIPFEQDNPILGLLLVTLLVIGWIGLGTINANVWRSLPRITAMIGRNPAAAEAELAQLMKRRPIMRWVRLLLYHRLAAIRHRQRRFRESAAICRSLLSQPLGPARRQRGSMLLMLAEASLQCRDMYSAYTAICELHAMPLSLAERLQRLAIQTQYEIINGNDRAALGCIQQKLLQAELMPAEHCGAMHAILTVSAKRAGKTELADWLGRRAQLLCSPEQLDRMTRGGFAIGIVGPPE